MSTFLELWSHCRWNSKCFFHSSQSQWRSFPPWVSCPRFWLQTNLEWIFFWPKWLCQMHHSIRSSEEWSLRSRLTLADHCTERDQDRMTLIRRASLRKSWTLRCAYSLIAQNSRLYCQTAQTLIAQIMVKNYRLMIAFFVSGMTMTQSQIHKL